MFVLGLKVFFFIGLVIFSACVAYTGWYFGFNAGFAKAKNQYSKSFYSSVHTAKPSIVNSLQNNSSGVKRISSGSSKPIFQFADNAKSVQEAKRVIEKAKRLKRNENNRNENSRYRSGFLRTAKAEPKLLPEKSVNCRWTVGRLGELSRIIRSGGKGRDSKFCEEFRLRLGELAEHKCNNRTGSNRGDHVLAGVC